LTSMHLAFSRKCHKAENTVGHNWCSGSTTVAQFFIQRIPWLGDE
jgi:hypothetical protein